MALLLILICLLLWLRILLVEIIGIRVLLCNCYVVVAEVGIFVFSHKLLCIAAWAVLYLVKHLIKAVGKVVAVWLLESLFLLFLLIYLFLQLHRRLIKKIGLKGSLLYLFLLIRLLLQLYKHLVEVIGLKSSLLSDAYVAALFDGALFAVVVSNPLLLVVSIYILI